MRAMAPPVHTLDPALSGKCFQVTPRGGLADRKGLTNLTDTDPLAARHQLQDLILPFQAREDTVHRSLIKRS